MTVSTKRTTLTLPASALQQAKKLATERHVTLSTAVAELIEDGLALRARTKRADEMLAAYQTAFSGLTEEERLLLDGIELEPQVDQ